MSPAEQKCTKNKILKTASQLFAKNGFGGTSIREISKMAEVNLAAINYHFKNKENLYWEVFNYNYDWINIHIHKMGENCNSTEDLASAVLHFFLSDGAPIMNTFKIFLSDDVAYPENLNNDVNVDRIGPPGQNVFLDKIQKDLDKEVSIESRKWATKMIFSLIVHFGIVMNTSLMKKKCEIDKEYSFESIKESLIMSVRAHLQYLKPNNSTKQS